MVGSLQFILSSSLKAPEWDSTFSMGPAMSPKESHSLGRSSHLCCREICFLLWLSTWSRALLPTKRGCFQIHWQVMNFLSMPCWPNALWPTETCSALGLQLWRSPVHAGSDFFHHTVFLPIFKFPISTTLLFWSRIIPSQSNWWGWLKTSPIQKGC